MLGERDCAICPPTPPKQLPFAPLSHLLLANVVLPQHQSANPIPNCLHTSVPRALCVQPACLWTCRSGNRLLPKSWCQAFGAGPLHALPPHGICCLQGGKANSRLLCSMQVGATEWVVVLLAALFDHIGAKSSDFRASIGQRPPPCQHPPGSGKRTALCPW